MRSSLEADSARFILKRSTPHDFEWVYEVKMPFPPSKWELVGRHIGFSEASGALVEVFEPLKQADFLRGQADRCACSDKRFHPIYAP